MAVYGVISDVHANLTALRRALAFLDWEPIDRLVCLGDIVGYNSEPDACVELVRSRGVDCIAGNHELMALGMLPVDRCPDKVAFAIRRTARVLGGDARDFLRSLPLTRAYPDGLVLVHGTFQDVGAYMSSEERVLENAAVMRGRHPAATICLYGHTHVPRLSLVDGAGVRQPPRADASRISFGDGGALAFINPGSVDAARRDDPFAELAIVDTDRRTVRFQRVLYPKALVEAQARACGYRMGRVTSLLARARRFWRRGRGLLVRVGGRWLRRMRGGPQPC
jgi:predicted phosphodiesterase